MADEQVAVVVVRRGRAVGGDAELAQADPLRERLAGDRRRVRCVVVFVLLLPLVREVGELLGREGAPAVIDVRQVGEQSP
ncbi:hypothetical protein QE412_002880 [Microbacterium trichothecenolyticum]|uniref:Uncharacterized protein n=1 Tax=Microbacterium trichothecenolyticum TaxID=69370 RepID=A0ABU0TZC8_MICTR|nr:hypothetical protein [Microbacterium trichothecenolyticum]MDQ1124307.1 hypothetical protein [Microbacterium trichothecenolyticum]